MMGSTRPEHVVCSTLTQEKLEKSWEEARKADTEARQATYLAEFKRNQLAKKKREEEEEVKEKRKTMMKLVIMLCGVFLAMITFWFTSKS